MDSPRDKSSWASADAQASFAWFTPIQPQPMQTWAGGFGWDPAGSSALEVLAVCDGVEVSVETRVVDAPWSDGVAQVSLKVMTAVSVPNLAIGSSTDTGLSESPPP